MVTYSTGLAATTLFLNQTAYLQYPPRVILVVGNAAIALPPLVHDALVKARVSQRIGATWLLACHSVGHSLESAPFFLDRLVLAMSHPKEQSSDDDSNYDNSDNNPHSDSDLVASAP